MEYVPKFRSVTLPVIQTNPDIPNYLNTPQRTSHDTYHSRSSPQYYDNRNETSNRLHDHLVCHDGPRLLSSPLRPTQASTSSKCTNGDDDDEQSDIANG
ncbi:hypothetical protein BASA83_013239 [Batrachochytrium salamandrivorans]|nr:hypothetical protein BASA83_013239 [Batrachochytrium salamandrivorans]